MTNSELKSFNIAQLGINPTIAGAIFNISRAIVLGDGSNQRDGAQINVQSVHFRANTRTTLTSSVRYILFTDRQNVGVDPLPGEVLASATFNSNYNNIVLNEQKRFHIIMDKTIDLSTNGLMNTTFQSTHRNLPKKLTYLLNTDVLGACGRNAIFIMIIGSTIVPFLDYDCTVRFIDQ